jgi:transcriptional regulator with XRE-family HTH domain
MRKLVVGRTLRMARLRRGRRQSDIGRAAGLSAATIGRHESGEVKSLASFERHAAVLDLRVELRLTGRGGEQARLADEEHAAIVELLARIFAMSGCIVQSELSFNEWGDRGRIDLAAFNARERILALVEVKAEITDIQEMFGRLDIKERLAATIAAKRGWSAQRMVLILAVAATDANRRLVSAHPTLFAGFTKRWPRGPAVHINAGDARLLLWINAEVAGRARWLAGRRRVRRVGRPTSGQFPTAGG